MGEVGGDKPIGWQRIPEEQGKQQEKVQEQKGSIQTPNLQKGVSWKKGVSTPESATIWEKALPTTKQSSSQPSEKASSTTIELPKAAKEAFFLLRGSETDKQVGMAKLFDIVDAQGEKTNLMRKIVSDLTKEGKGELARDFVKYAILREEKEEATKQSHSTIFRGNVCASAGYGTLTRTALEKSIQKTAESHKDTKIMGETKDQSKIIKNYKPLDAFLSDLINCMTKDQKFVKDFLEIHKELLEFSKMKYPDNPAEQKLFLANVFLLRCVSPALTEGGKKDYIDLATALLKGTSPEGYAKLPDTTLNNLLALANALVIPQKK